MANTLDPMDLKQIITLHIDGESNRQIGELLKISRNTVNTYIRYFKACDYSLKELFPSHTTIVNINKPIIILTKSATA